MRLNLRNREDHLLQPDSIVERLSSVRRNYPDKRALIVSDGLSYSHDELERVIEKFRVNLREQGVKKGSAVALMLPNGIELIASFLALNMLECAAVILNPALSRDEFSFALEDSGASFLITTGDQSLDVRVNQVGGAESHSNAPTGASLVMYTSGTTARPKGVALSNTHLIASMESFIRSFQLSADDVALMVMPLFHIHGLVGVTLSTLLSAGTVVVCPRFSAGSFWPLAVRYGATWYSASPTIHRILYRQSMSETEKTEKTANGKGRAGHRLRFIRSSGAPMGKEEIEAIESRFETVLLSAYGMTESANQISANPLPPEKRKSETVGVPRGVSVRVIAPDGRDLAPGETGEIIISGPSVIKQYHRRPEADRTGFIEGWLRTGDQGRIDQDGFISVTGRLKDLIIRGGENIAPQEVELALLRHPDVLEAACFGQSDSKYGEEVYAAVVVGGDAHSEDLLRHCRELLSPFKVPKKIYLTPSLPKNATSKIERRRLSELFKEQS